MSRFGKFVLMVNRLPWTVGKNELRKHFEQFGKIRNISVPYNLSTGMHRGYGFVTFDSKVSLENALDNKHVIDGEAVLVVESKGPNESKQRFVNDENE